MNSIFKKARPSGLGNVASGFMLFVLSGAGLSLAIGTASAGEDPYVYYGINFEQFEYRLGAEKDLLVWDGDAFVGTDEVKLRLRSSGDYSLDDSAFEALEHQGLVQVPVSDFFDAKAGLRYDSPVGENRGYAVLGFQGLAPQWFEVEGDVYLSEKGDVSARLEVDYELLLTNRLILTPTAEIDVAFSDDAQTGVGSGLSSIETGLRLSYDLVGRSIAPYVGVNYERSFGQTKDYAREDGEAADDVALVAGVRLLF
ncbi:copper resistance protein B [Kiloniella antarctica]|uniref:Copper resistance protein B n=1 Tax=Kiloniella antarctica TaxID=1550907 RepID=A0ABW5BMF6_9PROT